MKDWQPPKDWRAITTIDAHTGGEPFRIVTGGFPEIPGDSILDKRRFVTEHLDHLRTALMWEPRGHADMYGCLVTPPCSPEADLGVLFMHNEGYSTMCGHGIIALATVALETGFMPAHEPETALSIESPAGLITARARVQGSRVKSVAFENVPSFVLADQEEVRVPGADRVTYSIAYGGAFYALVEAEGLGLSLEGSSVQRLIELGRAVKEAITAVRPVVHPFEPDLGFLYGTIFVGPAEGSLTHSRNVCVFANGEVDRSPTGTGVSARLASHYARGEIDLLETVTVESIIGSRFSGRVLRETSFGPYPAVIPEVEGSASITGRQEFLLDPEDPLVEGFLLR
jgi:trans-L-3-hydroxyproline dehydratase